VVTQRLDLRSIVLLFCCRVDDAVVVQFNCEVASVVALHKLSNTAPRKPRWSRRMFSALLSKAPLIASRSCKMLGSQTFALGSLMLGSAAAAAHAPLDLLAQQVRQRSNRSRRGLYDGKDVRFGNSVTFSKSTTRRKVRAGTGLELEKRICRAANFCHSTIAS